MVIHSSGCSGRQEMLRARQAARTRCNEVVGELKGAFLQAIGGNHFRHHAKFLCFRCFDDASSQQEIARTLVSDLPREKHRNDCGQESDLHLGVSEFRLRRAQREVTERLNAATTAVARSIYSRPPPPPVTHHNPHPYVSPRPPSVP